MARNQVEPLSIRIGGLLAAAGFAVAAFVAAKASAAQPPVHAKAAEGIQGQRTDLWQLARRKVNIHRFSTLFPARNVTDLLDTPEELEQAIRWCKATGVTKVYLEVFRSNHWADRELLVRVRDAFRREGFVVCGGVTTTLVGKRSTGWNIISCYTDRRTQEQLEKIFRYAASLFDTVMIDDFWFTDCRCEQCKEAKGQRSWSAYRCDLMLRLSRERIIEPARAVNPRVKLIIKYPQWYDQFHERGYDVRGESDLFDVTWIGTETRDPDNARWGRLPQFGAYWTARWAAAFSRGKLGGGWFDPYGTSPPTYVEQARQTILAQCRESVLFCYGSLLRDTGPANVDALRAELPGLLKLAEFVRERPIRGVGTYKPAGSDGGGDLYIFNFLGMLGIPMDASDQFPADSPALLLTEHAAADPKLLDRLETALSEGKHVLVTSNLLNRLPRESRQQLMKRQNLSVLDLSAGGRKRSTYGVLAAVRDMLTWPRARADELRRPLLEPFGIRLSAPPKVALYLYGHDRLVLENFRDEPAAVSLAIAGRADIEPAVVLPSKLKAHLQRKGNEFAIELPPRSLLALRLAPQS